MRRVRTVAVHEVTVQYRPYAQGQDGPGWRWVCTYGRKGRWVGYPALAERAGNEHANARKG